MRKFLIIFTIFRGFEITQQNIPILIGPILTLFPFF